MLNICTLVNEVINITPNTENETFASVSDLYSLLKKFTKVK